MLFLYILWGDWPIFIISDSNEQLQQQLEYTLLKPDCHSWWISKMQSRREDTLEERYAVKSCFNLGKNATEMYRMLQTAFGASCMNRASVFEWHKRFREGRGSVRDDERYARSKEVNRPELIGQRLGLLCWGFKGVQEENPSEEARTLQIGSVAFPPGQCTRTMHRLQTYIYIYIYIYIYVCVCVCVCRCVCVCEREREREKERDREAEKKWLLSFCWFLSLFIWMAYQPLWLI